MSRFIKLTMHTIISLTAIVLLAGLAGCSGHKVELIYHSLGPSMSADPNLPVIMVSEFQNGMPDTQIGTDSDGEPFEANSSVTAWATESFANELVRLGVRASYSPYLSPDVYIIKGTLDQLWIEKNGPSQYTVKIALSIEFPQTTDLVVLKKSYTAEQSSPFVLTDADISKLVESTMQDVVIKAAVETKAQLLKI